MATIYNSDLSKELVAGARIQQNVDKVPNELAEKVVPVMETNPKLLRRTNYFKVTSSNATGSLTIATSPTDKELYITSVFLNCVKDAASDCVATGIAITNELGENSFLLYKKFLTLTAADYSQTLTLLNPFKVKAGTGITIEGSFTVGNTTRAGGIIGYTVENSTA